MAGLRFPPLLGLSLDPVDGRSGSSHNRLKVFPGVPTMKATHFFFFWAVVSLAWGQEKPQAQVPPAKPATHKPAAKPVPFKVSPGEIESVRVKAEALGQALARLKAGKVDRALIPDVEVFHRAATMLLRFSNEEFFTQRFVTDALSVLDLGLKRAEALDAGRAPWASRQGRFVRGYRSRLDGTAQPYGLSIPPSYDGKTPMRLDVILHGRGATLSEVNFIAARELTNAALAGFSNAIRLEVYGRWNNAYRYAGEVDVFEAMQSVMSRYRIETNAIVLRGFSMGGGGAWHLGLHHPGQWAALESGAGFTETIRFTRSSNMPPEQLRVLPIFDTDGAALNAWNLPVVGYGGEDDKQLAASVNIREQLEREGFHFVQEGLNYSGVEFPIRFLVGPKTGHKWHPESQAASDAFIDEALAKPRAIPDRIRFVAFTTRYDRCHWLRIDTLTRHYERAEVDAVRKDGGKRVELSLSNVDGFTLLMEPPQSVSINGAILALPTPLPKGLPYASFLRTEKGWAVATALPDERVLRKRHGLSGPIDDAFMEPFLCVKPTGAPFSRPVVQQSLALLDRFVFLFGKWLRGDVRIKEDREVDAKDIADYNLVLFGDPSANKVFSRVIDRLPIKWNKDFLQLGTNRYPTAEYFLAMVYPNPLNPKKYLVLNTGHTIPEKDWRGNNALQFGKWGDWAILKAETNPTNLEALVACGFFGERWEIAP
ncbi:MAG: hypothetical protein J0L75_10140 [Spirochaetes bacterium]|nr:hypothetical protein [Spirochaetota bacterium]